MRTKVAEKRSQRTRPRLQVDIVGMPELRAAADAGLLRAALHIPLTTKGLGAKAIELAADEEVVARTPLQLEADDGRLFRGEALLIAKRDALPRLKLGADDPRLAELARVLAREAGQS
jgi:hypothetical protein